jgi:hypothetical protein
MSCGFCTEGILEVIAEEKLDVVSEQPCLTGADGTIIDAVKGCVFQSIIPFRQVIKNQFRNIKQNENDLTQDFVHQIDAQIKKYSYSFGVHKQYYDNYCHTRGISDFYFTEIEEGVDHRPFFVVEAKRLPAPDNYKVREKEYVVGGKNNGGLERYKTKTHGKWLSESGMLGFIEKGSFSGWAKTINSWIEDVSEIHKDWSKDEILIIKDSTEVYCYLTSVTHRISIDSDINLCHWWIDLVNL